MLLQTPALSTRRVLNEVDLLKNYDRPVSFHTQVNSMQHWVGVSFAAIPLSSKKPLKVLLKAPFHYKKGKHRLTTKQYRFVYKFRSELSFNCSKPQKLLSIIDTIAIISNSVPAITSTLSPGNYTKLKFVVPVESFLTK